jgi:hypothetical protein
MYLNISIFSVFMTEAMIRVYYTGKGILVSDDQGHVIFNKGPEDRRFYQIAHLPPGEESLPEPTSRFLECGERIFLYNRESEHAQNLFLFNSSVRVRMTISKERYERALGKYTQEFDRYSGLVTAIMLEYAPQLAAIQDRAQREINALKQEQDHRLGRLQTPQLEDFLNQEA